MWRLMTSALTFLRCSHACSYVSSGNDGPPSAWHITQWLLRILTISRSKRTVVFTVSCGDAGRAANTSASAASANPALTLRRNDIEGDRERVEPVVATELRPGAVPPGLRHQALERHVGSAAQLLQIGARRNREHRRPAVVVRPREDVERMRVDVLGHVLAHDQRVAEGAEIGL